jgi:hypothetical protein
MPLLTISWAADLETSVGDQNNGSYLDLAEDKEDLDFLWTIVSNVLTCGVALQTHVKTQLVAARLPALVRPCIRSQNSINLHGLPA